jgi:plasmid stabilization system protein ParE
MKVRLTPEAKADLEGIGDRIAERNPARAVTYVRELRDRALRIGEFPHAGPPRPQWGQGIRIAVHGKYLIVYRVRDGAVQILRVVHGARDLDTLFEEEPLPE